MFHQVLLRLFLSKEHVWSDEVELLQRVSTKLNVLLTQNLENFSESGFKIEIKI